MSFTCNICSANVDIAFEDLDREGGICPHCSSNVRMRSLAHLLSLSLLGKSIPVCEWPKRPEIFGIGISDWYKFTDFLGDRLSYINTHYDRPPFLDIRKPPLKYRGAADFVICSDVLEHVSPPVEDAFQGMLSLLKPGGVLIFSVPYGLEHTLEHFPELHDWKLEKDGDEDILLNRTIDGKSQVFRNLVFHGGTGQVLEMRLFGIKDLTRHFDTAGFDGVRILQENVPEYGIRFKDPWSLPMTAHRPARRSLIAQMKNYMVDKIVGRRELKTAAR